MIYSRYAHTHLLVLGEQQQLSWSVVKVLVSKNNICIIESTYKVHKQIHNRIKEPTSNVACRYQIILSYLPFSSTLNSSISGGKVREVTTHNGKWHGQIIFA